jgi:hypothetical protein
MTDTELEGLCERLRYSDPFVNDPISLKPRLRNPDGPAGAAAIEHLRSDLAVAMKALEAIRQSGIDRDDEWTGMNANDIARTTLANLKGRDVTSAPDDAFNDALRHGEGEHGDECEE